jgi:hypothetical protein
MTAWVQGRLSGRVTDILCGSSVSVRFAAIQKRRGELWSEDLTAWVMKGKDATTCSMWTTTAITTTASEQGRATATVHKQNNINRRT